MSLVLGTSRSCYSSARASAISPSEPDPTIPGHYFLRADTIYHHLQWAQTRDAEGTHYLTQALMVPPVYLGFERI
jgi:hypothetical protein